MFENVFKLDRLKNFPEETFEKNNDWNQNIVCSRMDCLFCCITKLASISLPGCRKKIITKFLKGPYFSVWKFASLRTFCESLRPKIGNKKFKTSKAARTSISIDKKPQNFLTSTTLFKKHWESAVMPIKNPDHLNSYRLSDSAKFDAFKSNQISRKWFDVQGFFAKNYIAKGCILWLQANGKWQFLDDFSKLQRKKFVFHGIFSSI